MNIEINESNVVAYGAFVNSLIEFGLMMKEDKIPINEYLVIQKIPLSPKKKRNKKVFNNFSEIETYLKDCLTFEKVFDYYHLKYSNNKIPCPFHNEKEPSLSYSNKKKVWHCFGCEASGDIISFIRFMEEKKSGNEKRGG